MVIHATVEMPVPVVRVPAPPKHRQFIRTTGECMTMIIDIDTNLPVLIFLNYGR